VVRFKSNRAVLAIAAYNDWEIHQIDVKNTYLNTELTETIYMKQLPSFSPPRSEGQVCRLFKALYGLKQAGHCWYHRVCEAFGKFLYTWYTSEHCVFYKHVNGQTIIVVVAIDDLTLVSSCGRLLTTCKDELWSEFEISDLGPIHWLLGVEVK